jgi:hypothetical protein
MTHARGVVVSQAACLRPHVGPIHGGRGNDDGPAVARIPGHRIVKGEERANRESESRLALQPREPMPGNAVDHPYDGGDSVAGFACGNSEAFR